MGSSAAVGGARQYLVVPCLVATPLQQALFNSERAALQRGVRELEVRLRRRARALRALGRATIGPQVSAMGFFIANWVFFGAYKLVNAVRTHRAAVTAKANLNAPKIRPICNGA